MLGFRTRLSAAYPLDFGWFARSVLDGSKGRLEKDGSLLIGYGPLVGWRKNPTSQSILGLGLLQLWSRTADRAMLTLSLKTADALVRQAGTAEGSALGFPIAIRPLGYRLAAPWYSALSQGMAASFFCRVGAVTDDPAWLARAKGALDFVVESPGLTCREAGGRGVWFEETPTDPPTHILNGHIYCTIAFNEVAASTNEEKYARYFAMGVDAVAANLQAFDAGGLSYYDGVRRILAKPYYQRLHVEQLRYLQELAPEPRLGEYARRWEVRMSERWGALTWARYSWRTMLNGFRAEGASYPLKALPYLLGENGIRRTPRKGAPP